MHKTNTTNIVARLLGICAASLLVGLGLTGCENINDDNIPTPTPVPTPDASFAGTWERQYYANKQGDEVDEDTENATLVTEQTVFEGNNFTQRTSKAEFKGSFTSTDTTITLKLTHIKAEGMEDWMLIAEFADVVTKQLEQIKEGMPPGYYEAAIAQLDEMTQSKTAEYTLTGNTLVMEGVTWTKK